MIHPNLLNALKSLGADIPPDATPSEAWRVLNPERKMFINGSFWYVLASRLPLSRSSARQKELAEWIYRQYRIATLPQNTQGQEWPPVKVTIRPRFIPVPNPL